jgi:hypothetical protein
MSIKLLLAGVVGGVLIVVLGLTFVNTTNDNFKELLSNVDFLESGAPLDRMIPLNYTLTNAYPNLIICNNEIMHSLGTVGFIADEPIILQTDNETYINTIIENCIRITKLVHDNNINLSELILDEETESIKFYYKTSEQENEQDGNEEFDEEYDDYNSDEELDNIEVIVHDSEEYNDLNEEIEVVVHDIVEEFDTMEVIEHDISEDLDTMEVIEHDISE